MRHRYYDKSHDVNRTPRPKHSLNWSGERNHLSHRYNFREFFNPSNPPTSNSALNSLSGTYGRVGAEVKSYRFKILSHLDATGQFSAFNTQYKAQQGRMVTYYDIDPSPLAITAFRDTSYGQLIRDTIVPPIDSSLGPVAKSRAAIGFLGKVRKVNHLFSSLTFVGELQEALHMIRKPAEALQKRFLNYGNRVMKHGSRIRKSARQAWVSDTWLEYSFGWAPTLSDIDSGVQALASVFDKTLSKYVSFRALADSGTNQTIGYETAAGSSYNEYLKSLSVYNTCETKYRGVVLRVPDPSVADLAVSRFGLNPYDFVPTAYELMPWSFLIDYVTNVGNLCNAYYTDTRFLSWHNYTNNFASDRLTLGIVDKNRVLKSVGYKTNGNPLLHYVVGDVGHFMVRSTLVNRGNGDIGSTPLRVEFQNNLNPFKVLNVIALRRNISRFLPYF
jgi:hypothetical protein